ncbi:3'-5' exonuclease [Burkholderia cenocepacia]|uniref:3'-5' exonuclease n=1 Tax=Burkholderia cenocepacia TaxID=95486 RepID=UPI002ABD4C14|nr:3'-5' exonuclease [Burkholderia cenocepacia]
MNAPTTAEPTDAMVDLETLGTEPFCPILSIGACAFNADSFSVSPDVFYQAITLESCISLGLRVDANTLGWWMDQAPAAQAVFRDPQAVTLPLALDAFTDWWNSRPMRIWGNSARFDMGILAAAYKACGKEIPWRWRDERCHRTVCNLPGAKDVPFERYGTYHNALDDALSQANHLQKVYRALGFTPQ